MTTAKVDFCKAWIPDRAAGNISTHKLKVHRVPTEQTNRPNDAEWSCLLGEIAWSASWNWRLFVNRQLMLRMTMWLMRAKNTLEAKLNPCSISSKQADTKVYVDQRLLKAHSHSNWYIWWQWSVYNHCQQRCCCKQACDSHWACCCWIHKASSQHKWHEQEQP